MEQQTKRKVGRPRKYSDNLIAEAKPRFAAGQSLYRIAKDLGFGSMTPVRVACKPKDAKRMREMTAKYRKNNQQHVNKKALEYYYKHKKNAVF